jgi:hypothetical protein
MLLRLKTCTKIANIRDQGSVCGIYDTYKPSSSHCSTEQVEALKLGLLRISINI